jgi:hypothetical protein
MKTTRKIDLSTKAGNPTRRIQDAYSHLMGIHELDTLKTEALKLIDEGGVSPKNAGKFRSTVASQNSVLGVQKYLTNFMLAGSGLSPIKNGHW